MNESVYSTLNKCCETLKLDFSAEEFARLAADKRPSQILCKAP